MGDSKLLRNDEWQLAAFGTPDDDTCLITANEPEATGSKVECRSDADAADMVGNVSEWTADWMQGNQKSWEPSTGTADSAYGNDAMLGVNPAISQGFSRNMPGALYREGRSFSSTTAGVFALSVGSAPSNSLGGFRCGR